MIFGCGALLAAVQLAGCSRSKTADLAACERETMRFYSDSGGDDFMIACMDARGYRFDVEPADCDGKSRMARQPACYVQEGWLAEFVDRLGRSTKPASPAARLGSEASRPSN